MYTFSALLIVMPKTDLSVKLKFVRMNLRQANMFLSVTENAGVQALRVKALLHNVNVRPVSS